MSKVNKSLKAELKRIQENNSKLDDIAIFKESLNYTWEKNQNKKSISENSSSPYTIRETEKIISFTVEHYIDTESLENWINSSSNDTSSLENRLTNNSSNFNQYGFDVEYALRSFTKFDKKNKNFLKFKEQLNMQKILRNSGYINDYSFSFDIYPISQTKNKFNEEYFNNKENRVWFFDSSGESIFTEKNHKRQKFLEKYFPDSGSGIVVLDNVLIELLLRGNQILKISYDKFEVDLTDKALKLLNDNWCKRNGNWFWPLLVSIIPIIISIIAIVLKQK